VLDELEAESELNSAYVKDLHEAYETYQRDGDVEALLAAVQDLETATEQEQEAAPANQLMREDLHLVCWEYVWS
jgi:deoxyadenosine/deoxycytidine kinase